MQIIFVNVKPVLIRKQQMLQQTLSIVLELVKQRPQHTLPQEILVAVIQAMLDYHLLE